ncbi:MAG: mechanosensitive ion channel family protein [Firmicutes bacterium]|nr:mechanosensitive ion channel family protein [Bacillota bacterium]
MATKKQQEEEILRQKEQLEKQQQELERERENEIKQKKRRTRRIIYWSIIGFLMIMLFAAAPIASAIWPATYDTATSTYRYSGFVRFLQENTLDITNIGNFFSDNIETILRGIVTIFILVLVLKVLWIVTRLLSRGKSNRRKTILALTYSFLKYALILVGFFTLLGVLGVDAAALIAGAGILGLVIAFGAQSLLSDIIAGLFIVFENSFEVGDIITFNGNRGEVEHIGIRTTKIKAIDGNIIVINNSEMRVLINMTQEKSVAVCDVTVSYDENLERVEKVLRDAMPEIGKKLDAAVDEPKYIGPAEFNASGIVLRNIAFCQEPNRMQLTRDFNRELKLLFDKHKIKFAVPNVDVKSSLPRK